MSDVVSYDRDKNSFKIPHLSLLSIQPSIMTKKLKKFKDLHSKNRKETHHADNFQSMSIPN